MSEIFTKVENLAKRGVIVEFKEFINRGNVIDLAVAFVMGAAFKTVVDSFAGSDKGPGILGGLIGAIFGGQQPDFSKKVLTVNGSDRRRNSCSIHNGCRGGTSNSRWSLSLNC